MNPLERVMKIEDLMDLCKAKGIKTFAQNGMSFEFFPSNLKEPEPMALDPVALSKILSASMPADDKMLFAATEDPDPAPNPEAMQE